MAAPSRLAAATQHAPAHHARGGAQARPSGAVARLADLQHVRRRLAYLPQPYAPVLHPVAAAVPLLSARVLADPAPAVTRSPTRVFSRSCPRSHRRHPPSLPYQVNAAAAANFVRALTSGVEVANGLHESIVAMEDGRWGDEARCESWSGMELAAAPCSPSRSWRRYASLLP
jgi:hypothetical protein